MEKVDTFEYKKSSIYVGLFLFWGKNQNINGHIFFNQIISPTFVFVKGGVYI